MKLPVNLHMTSYVDLRYHPLEGEVEESFDPLESLEEKKELFQVLLGNLDWGARSKICDYRECIHQTIDFQALMIVDGAIW